MASAQQERIARFLKRLGFELGKGRGKAFKTTAAGGSAAPGTSDTMTLDQIERWIGNHIKQKRWGRPSMSVALKRFSAQPILIPAGACAAEPSP
jgi:hypothetical protein